MGSESGRFSYLRMVCPAQRLAAASDVPQPNLDVPQRAKKIWPAAGPTGLVFCWSSLLYLAGFASCLPL
jgi:hypothetical protein